MHFKSRRLRWAGHVARMEEGRSAFNILTGKPTGKRPLERPRRRWKNNIRMDLEEIGIEYLGPRGMRMRSGEGSTMRNFIVCTVHLIKSE